MGRPKKIKEVPATEQGENTSDTGVPGLFQPQEWDIQEELQGNEALREFQRESAPDWN